MSWRLTRAVLPQDLGEGFVRNLAGELLLELRGQALLLGPGRGSVLATTNRPHHNSSEVMTLCSTACQGIGCWGILAHLVLLAQLRDARRLLPL